LYTYIKVHVAVVSPVCVPVMSLQMNATLLHSTSSIRIVSTSFTRPFGIDATMNKLVPLNLTRKNPTFKKITIIINICSNYYIIMAI